MQLSRLVLFGAGPDGVIGTADDIELADTVTASPYTFDNLLDGDYRIFVDTATLPEGVGTTFDADGGLDELITVTIAGSDVFFQDFAFAHPIVTGTITDSNGNLLSGVSVQVVDAAGTVFTAVTGPDGVYAVEGSAAAPMAAGSGTVTVTFATGTQVSSSIVVEPPMVMVADFVAQLPATGLEIGDLVHVGVLLVMLGGLLLMVARRREDEAAVIS